MMPPFDLERPEYYEINDGWKIEARYGSGPRGLGSPGGS